MLYMEIFLDMIQAMNEGRKCRFQVRTKLEHSKAGLSFKNQNPQSQLIFPSSKTSVIHLQPFLKTFTLKLFRRFYSGKY